MTFTYDSSDLTSDLSRVRLLVFDTDSTRPLLQDEEIAFFLVQFPDIFRAAASSCEAIAAKFGREIDRSVLATTDNPSRTAEFYLDLAERYRAQAGKSAEVFAGGLTISGKQRLAEDDDKIQPAFSVGQDDYRGVRQVADIGRYSKDEN